MLAFLALSLVSIQAQIDIAQARLLPIGTTVTISGRVTNGQELGSIRYVEDGTGGLPAFPGSGSVSGFASQVKRGDSLMVTGVLYDFNGLLELSPITAFTVLATNGTIPEPPTRTIAQINEALEGTLARFESVSFLESGDFKGDATYTIQDVNGQTVDVYIRNGQDLIGKPIPSAPVDLVGIISAYFGYQILPRDQNDLIPITDLYFVREIDQIDLTSTSVSFTWETNLSSTARVIVEDKFGLVKEETLLTSSVNHTHTIVGLDPASFYRIQVIAERQGEEVPGQRRWMSTASVLPGSITVYFNESVDQTFSVGPEPETTSGDDVLDAMIEWIQQATQTIDMSFYNIDQDVIVNALNIAHNKGVQVRYVAAEATSNSALSPPPAFPVIYGNDWALMHNKFMVIDAEDEERAAVFTGSMNLTTAQILSYPNNMVLIRDQAMARNYTVEFEEMWGSQGPFPEPDFARFGAEKLDNTPHLFKVNGSLVESYFSPSDFTNREILEELEAASSSIRFALLTFTRDDLAEAMIAKVGQGLEVRGIIENINDNGSEYTKILSAGVNVTDHVPSALLHHKYAVIDDAVVITGSHNWSNSAEQQNDENTVIIHDPEVANQFRQEFEARWGELPVSTHEEGEPGVHWVATIRDGSLFLRGAARTSGNGTVRLMDLYGRTILQVPVELLTGEHLYSLACPSLPSGYVIMEVTEASGASVRWLVNAVR